MTICHQYGSRIGTDMEVRTARVKDQHIGELTIMRPTKVKPQASAVMDLHISPLGLHTISPRRPAPIPIRQHTARTPISHAHIHHDVAKAIAAQTVTTPARLTSLIAIKR